jgi:predicted sugar kinase
MTRQLMLGSLSALLLLLGSAFGSTRAEAAVTCTVRSMVGLQSSGGIDKRLSFLRKQLKRPPFSAYKTIKLLAKQQIEMARRASKQVGLPNGTQLKLTFIEKLLIKKRVRLRLHLEISKTKPRKLLTNTVFTIADGGTLLLAGQAHQGGTLVVGVTCKGK